MKKFSSIQRGFVPIIAVSVVALLLIATGGYFYSKHKPKEKPTTDIAVKSIKEESKNQPSLEQQKSKTQPPPVRQIPQSLGTTETREKNPINWMGDWLKTQSGSSASTQNRPGWEILSEAEKAQLPECQSVLMTTSPVPLGSITNIEPIGSANPPEHTLASISSDTYIGVQGQGTTATTPLVAPGDIWIILIVPRYGVTQDPEDHVMKYAFCKDVYGVVDHVKSFSPEIKKVVDEYKCPNPNDKPGDNNCPMQILKKVSAGAPLGTVGRMQGNFNFGTWDLRVSRKFISPGRHGFLTKHSVCPFDYFSSPLKEQLTAKLEPTAGGNCGTVEHDVAGTLQGDWFIGDASPTRPADWGKLLHFGSSNRFAGQSVISASGIFISKPTRWIFTATTSGNSNRKFSEVTLGSIYCFDNDGNHLYKDNEKGVLSGKILVELTSPTELQIEHQEGSCSTGNWKFNKPTSYQR